MNLIDPNKVPKTYDELSLLLRDKLDTWQFRAFEEIFENAVSAKADTVSDLEEEVEDWRGRYNDLCDNWKETIRDAKAIRNMAEEIDSLCGDIIDRE